MKVPKILPLNLQLFADGGASAGGGAGEGATTGDNSQNPAVATGENNQNPADERAALYKQARADFKSEFDAEVQSTVKSRLKTTKTELNAANEYRRKAESIFSMIADKYGVDPGNLDALMEQVKKDNSYYEDLAMKNGTTPEQERRLRQIERENAQFKAKEAADNERAAYMQRYEALLQQEAEVKALYPDFDFETESQNNPTFRRLCAIADKVGMSMLNVYNAVHHDDIVARGIQYAANQAAAKTQAAIDNNKSRPSENGLNHSIAADTKVDVNKLTPEQMKEYIDKVKSGQRVSFS